MFAGTALSVRLLVYAGLSLFIISGPYLYMVVCVLYVYNLTIGLDDSAKVLIILMMISQQDLTIRFQILI